MDSITKVIENTNSLPVIAGVEITTDAEGRFNLNALHRASGGEKKNGPSYWLALETTQALINELEQRLSDTEISVSVIKSIKGGLNQGSYAHELLAIAYASWISPSFHLQVNQVFLDYRTGKLQPVKQVDPMEVLKDPSVMRGLLLSYSEKVLELEDKIQETKPVVAAYERIAVADGSLNLTESAKALQVRPKDLSRWLQANGWIYRRNGSKNWLGYQVRVSSGLIEHKVTSYAKADGTEGIAEQVRLTPKGLAVVAKQLVMGDAA